MRAADDVGSPLFFCRGVTAFTPKAAAALTKGRGDGEDSMFAAGAYSFFHGMAASRASKPRPVPLGGMKSGVMSIPSSSEKALGR